MTREWRLSPTRRQAVVAGLAMSMYAVPAAAQEQAWVRQFGTNGYDHAYALASRAGGGVFIAGQMEWDAFVAAYGRDGSQLWLRRFGTGTGERTVAYGVAADGAGGVYVAGQTAGDLGSPLAGQRDAFLARFDGSGSQLWVRQFGTSGHDRATGLAADGAGGAYVSAYTQGALGGAQVGPWDAVLIRFDSDGEQLWARQIGSAAADGAHGVAPDGIGGVFIGGGTNGNLAGQNNGFGDSWVARYDSAGNQMWIRQFGIAGSAMDARGLAPDGAGGVFLAGVVALPVPEPVEDAWVARFDDAGQQLWLRHDVIQPHDRNSRAYAAAHDGAGGVLVAGTRYPYFLFPEPDDAFIARHDADGNQTWTRTLWSGSFWDEASAVATDEFGSAYVAGFTWGNLGGPNAGTADAFLARYDAAGSCYPNCDGSTTEPILTVDDFTCFVNEFALAVGLPQAQQIEHYANCDGSTEAPVLTVDDFTCFVNAFAAGCP